MATLFKVMAWPTAPREGFRVNPANFQSRSEAEQFRLDYLAEHPGFECEIDEVAA